MLVEVAAAVAAVATAVVEILDHARNSTPIAVDSLVPGNQTMSIATVMLTLVVYLFRPRPV